ncbi:MAG TPA: hypothetical protein VGQ78_06375 [Vicinamibacteria bacterium]|nr:hypothetical protein [Vicinamibacteria bacterium]
MLLLLAAGGAASRPGGLWLGVPTLTATAVAVAVTVALAAFDRAGAGALCVGVLPVAALLLLGAPIPGLKALSGPPLFLLAATAAVLVVALNRPLRPAYVFLPVVFALYALVAARARVQVGAQGDEPHYLMVADSLLRDHDVSLERDYAEGRYRSFHPEPLAPHYRVRGKAGEIFSLHAVGLSVFILPAYALGGYAGASLLLALAGALTAREMRALVREVHGDTLAERVGWLLALSPPLIHYAGLIFTEVPAALLVAVALRHGATARGPRSALAFGLAVAALPWLNVRYAAFAVVLVLFALDTRPRPRLAALLLAPVAISALGLAAYHFHLYGFFDPRRVYGRRPELSLAILPEGLPGLLFDQEFGLLVYAPVFVLAVPGMAALYRRDRRRALICIALIVIALLTAGSWPMWRGGFNPPGRFLVPVLPALALPTAAALRNRIWPGAALLVGWGLWTGLTGAWQPGVVHRDRDETAPLFRTYSGAEEWTRLLPGWVLPERAAGRGPLTAVWVVALIAPMVIRGRPGWRRLILASSGLTLAAAAASRVSPWRSDDRDAVRVVGRPALASPGWRVTATPLARWDVAALGWGPLYEPHRFPEGAEVGRRLPLPFGRYELTIVADRVGGATGLAPSLEARPEPPGSQREYPFNEVAEGWRAKFEIGHRERATTLVLRGGDPMLLKSIELRRSTLPAVAGLIR